MDIDKSHNNLYDLSNKLDNEKIQTKWDQIQAKDLKKFFNMWSIISFIGNVIQLFGSGLALFDVESVNTSTELLVGFGCFLAYLNIGRYLEFNQQYSAIFATIQVAVPNVLRYFLGVMPIFFGFIFFGLCMFWRSERFVSVSSTMRTLFSLMNGDSVFDIFNELTQVNFIFGQLYGYIFCIIFIVVVMNIFVSIIEEAYVSTKMKNDSSIYSYLKIDPNYVELKELKELKEDEKDDKEELDNNLINNNHNYLGLTEKNEKRLKKLKSQEKSKNILREIVTNTNEHGRRLKTNDISKREIELIFEDKFGKVILKFLIILFR